MITVKNNRLIVTRKMSGTGSIHDLASDMFDRVVNLGTRVQYVVMLPAYYNAHATRHYTESGAIRQAKKDTADGYSPTIIDRLGNTYQLAYGELVKDI